MPLSAFDNQTVTTSWFSDDLTTKGMFDEDLITAPAAGGGAGTILVGAGSETLTGRNAILAFAIVMPPES